MTDSKKTEGETDEGALRAAMEDSGFDPDADAMKHGKVQPKILMPEARAAIESADRKAGKGKGRGR